LDGWIVQNAWTLNVDSNKFMDLTDACTWQTS